MSKLDKKATSKQVEIVPPKKMKATSLAPKGGAASKGEGASTVPPEDKKKTSTSSRGKKGGSTSKGEGASTVPPEDKKKTSTSSRGKKADALTEGHAKTIVEKNNAEMKPKHGTLIFYCLKLQILF
jgi:hypothetical protein